MLNLQQKLEYGEEGLIKSEWLNFMLAGHAIFTLKSLKTGNRFTYKITKSKYFNAKDSYYVFVLTGQDNNSHYTYMGTIKSLRFYFTEKSKIGEDAISFKAFYYVFYRLVNGIEIEDVEFWHSGRCARCGRLLTDPQSIRTGFGAVCEAINKHFSLQLNIL